MLIGESASADAAARSSCMRSGWTAFAAGGDPGWPAYDTEPRLTRIFDTRPTVTAFPEEISRRIWQEYTFSALPLVDW